MNDYTLIKPVIDITCWTDEEAASVINRLDHFILTYKIPMNGTTSLRYILVRLLEGPDEINPKYIKPGELFKRLSLHPKKDFIYMFGEIHGNLCKMFCEEYYKEVVRK